VLDASSVVRRSMAQVSCNLDEEVAVLNLEKSLYFSLSGVGAHVWELLEEPRSVDAICESVAGHFDITAEACRGDVLKFLGDLREAGLIKLAD